jgi:hypothetical protein
MKRHIRNKVKMNERWAEKKRLLRKQKAVEESEWVREREKNGKFVWIAFRKDLCESWLYPTHPHSPNSLSLSLFLLLPRRCFHRMSSTRIARVIQQSKKKKKIEREREREKNLLPLLFSQFLETKFSLARFHFVFVSLKIYSWWDYLMRNKREKARMRKKNVEIETP